MRWVAEPIPGEDEKSALSDAVNSDCIRMAEPVRNFEIAFAERHGAEEGLSLARRQQLSSGGYALTSLGRTERGPAAYPVVMPGASRAGIHHGMTAYAATVHGAMNAHQDALCPCGSGLRSCRCCEMDPAFAAPPEARRAGRYSCQSCGQGACHRRPGRGRGSKPRGAGRSPPFSECALDPLSDPPACGSRAGGAGVVAAARRGHAQ